VKGPVTTCLSARSSAPVVFSLHPFPYPNPITLTKKDEVRTSGIISGISYARQSKMFLVLPRFCSYLGFALVLSCLVLPCLVCLVLSCLLSCLLPCLVLSCLVLSCLVLVLLFCSVFLSCLVFFCLVFVLVLSYRFFWTGCKRRGLSMFSFLYFPFYVFFSVSRSFSQSVSLSVCLSLCVCLYVCVCVCMYVCMLVFFCLCLYVCLCHGISLSPSLLPYAPPCLSLSPSAYLSVCLR
jgi:hypothetical protein